MAEPKAAVQGPYVYDYDPDYVSDEDVEEDMRAVELEHKQAKKEAAAKKRVEDNMKTLKSDEFKSSVRTVKNNIERSKMAKDNIPFLKLSKEDLNIEDMWPVDPTDSTSWQLAFRMKDDPKTFLEFYDNESRRENSDVNMKQESLLNCANKVEKNYNNCVHEYVTFMNALIKKNKETDLIRMPYYEAKKLAEKIRTHNKKAIQSNKSFIELTELFDRLVDTYQRKADIEAAVIEDSWDYEYHKPPPKPTAKVQEQADKKDDHQQADKKDDHEQADKKDEEMSITEIHID